jgi:hypothetical protein
MEDVDSDFSIIIYFDKKPYARLVLAKQCKIFTLHRHIEFPLSVSVSERGAIAFFTCAGKSRSPLLRKRGYCVSADKSRVEFNKSASLFQVAGELYPIASAAFK